MSESRPPGSPPPVPPGAGSAPSSAPKLENENLATRVKEVDAFLDEDLPARNQLPIGLVLGVDPALAARIKRSTENRANAIDAQYTKSQEQLVDFLLERLIVFGGYYDEKHPTGNFSWFGEQGDAFGPHESNKLHDVAGYRTDGLGVLPAREKEKVPSPLMFRFDATTSATREGSDTAGFGTLKKTWLILHDIVTTGGFGNVPFVSVRMLGAPEAQAAGLLNAPRIVLAASREQTMLFARDVSDLKGAIEGKKAGDRGDEPEFLKDRKAREKAIERSQERRILVEKAENKIRTHELQLQFATQAVAQFPFFREFASVHLRRVNRAIYKAEHGGQELPEGTGKAFLQKAADDAWGTLGENLPAQLDDTRDAVGKITSIGLQTLKDNLRETIDRLELYERAARATYEELVMKLYLYEQEEGVPVHQRRKRFQRDIALKDIVLNDPAHLTLMALATDRPTQMELSKLAYTDLGFTSSPKTKLS